MIKKLLLVFAIGLLPLCAFGSAQSGTAVHILYSSASVGTNSWTPVVTSTVKAVKGISFYSSSISPIKLGIANAGAAAESEVVQLEFPGGIAGYRPNEMLYLPLVMSQSIRISLKADSSAATSGEALLNLMYN